MRLDLAGQPKVCGMLGKLRPQKKTEMHKNPSLLSPYGGCGPQVLLGCQISQEVIGFGDRPQEVIGFGDLWGPSGTSWDHLGPKYTKID